MEMSETDNVVAKIGDEKMLRIISSITILTSFVGGLADSNLISEEQKETVRKHASFLKKNSKWLYENATGSEEIGEAPIFWMREDE